jgi:hypothetical protein
MGKSLVVKDPKRGPVWSLFLLAAGIVAVGTFLWLTPADPDEQGVTPTAQPAALAPSAYASTGDVDGPDTVVAEVTTPTPLDLATLSAIWSIFTHLSNSDIQTLYPAFSPAVQRHIDMMANAMVIGVAY